MRLSDTSLPRNIFSGLGKSSAFIYLLNQDPAFIIIRAPCLVKLASNVARQHGKLVFSVNSAPANVSSF